jgi:hypothetical protein
VTGELRTETVTEFRSDFTDEEYADINTRIEAELAAGPNETSGVLTEAELSDLQSYIDERRNNSERLEQRSFSPTTGSAVQRQLDLVGDDSDKFNVRNSLEFGFNNTGTFGMEFGKGGTL